MMNLRNKEKHEVNLVCAALKKAGIKFEKNDVSVLNGGFVRLSFKAHSDIKIDDVIWELKAIGYDGTHVSTNRELCDGRRWFSLDISTYDIEGDPKRSPVRYVTIDEVYCSVYIDV